MTNETVGSATPADVRELCTLYELSSLLGPPRKSGETVSQWLVNVAACPGDAPVDAEHPCGFPKFAFDSPRLLRCIAMGGYGNEAQTYVLVAQTSAEAIRVLRDVAPLRDEAFGSDYTWHVEALAHVPRLLVAGSGAPVRFENRHQPVFDTFESWLDGPSVACPFPEGACRYVDDGTYYYRLFVSSSRAITRGVSNIEADGMFPVGTSFRVEGMHADVVASSEEVAALLRRDTLVALHVGNMPYLELPLQHVVEHFELRRTIAITPYQNYYVGLRFSRDACALLLKLNTAGLGSGWVSIRIYLDGMLCRSVL